MRDDLLKGLEALELPADSRKTEQLLEYVSLLLHYNAHTNLTAIREEKEIVEKHLLDSLLLVRYVDEYARNALDIGSGAGFPGMALAIWLPEIRFLLLDSVGKKTKFLETVKNELKLPNVEIVTGRAEDCVEGRRETFDLGFCRGVGALPVILEYMLPFLKKNGVFLAQKQNADEIPAAEKALRELGGRVERIDSLRLPFSQAPRTVIAIEKNGTTPGKYPRKAGIPGKRPL
ncbi:MAG: 16S rRNA (guanine(527)-N(7))-methyltransferase RsmG [Fusobacteriaceae bacterium]|jgi:16S rRNA (guanine527-N7)-methyltransferase|nr:16S rRNA (guanine(527)-N(7))-methyltransferase RsmG [Fusobacteriaceae bacterium]